MYMCTDGPFRGESLTPFGDPFEGMRTTIAGWADGHFAHISYELHYDTEPRGWVWRFVDAVPEPMPMGGRF